MPTIINSIHKYRPRGSWRQRPVKNIQKLVVHHSAAEASDNPEARLTQIMDWHLANSPAWMGLSYHYVITKNGNIYQTNNHEDLTWTDGVNWNSLGILVDGYFHAPNNNQPTSQQLESLEWFLTELATKHPEFSAGNNPLQDIVGHRDVGQTACPGDILYSKLVEIKQRINQNIKNPQPAKTPLPATNLPIPTQNMQIILPTIIYPTEQTWQKLLQATNQEHLDYLKNGLNKNEVNLNLFVDNYADRINERKQAEKLPVKDTTQIKNLLNQILNLI